MKYVTLLHAALLVAAYVFEVETADFGCVIPYKTGRFCSKVNHADESTKHMTIVDERDDRVTDFTISIIGSEGMKYLPIKVHRTFPNIDNYIAYYCDIEEVSKENFENLIKLKSINLRGNKLKTIGSDTFDGLINLKFIVLGRLLLYFKLIFN